MSSAYFVFPSDVDRAENEDLNRVCEYAEDLIEELERARTRCKLLRRKNRAQKRILGRNGAAVEERDQLKTEVERLRALWEKETERAHVAEGELLKSRVRLVTGKQERDQLKDQLYKYGCEDVDVIRCLKTLAHEHNHSDVPRYKDLAKRTMDKYVDRCTSVGSALAQHDAEVIERFARELGVFDPEYDDQEYIEVTRYAIKDYANQLRKQAKEVQ